MDQKQFDEMMDHWLQQRAGKETTAGENLLWARNAGITDGRAPQAFATREETVGMIHRALEYFFQQMICILREDK